MERAQPIHCHLQSTSGGVAGSGEGRGGRGGVCLLDLKTTGMRDVCNVDLIFNVINNYCTFEIFTCTFIITANNFIMCFSSFFCT